MNLNMVNWKDNADGSYVKQIKQGGRIRSYVKMFYTE